MMSQTAAAAGLPPLERRSRIASVLELRGYVSVRTLADELAVSDMTVRRDLRQMAKDGDVRLVHGGATLTHGTLRTSDFVARARVASDAKRTIARRALEFIQAGDTVALDAGTTAFAVAEAIDVEAPVTVVTNSVPVLQLSLSRPNLSVLMLGGELAVESQALVGPLSVQAAESLRVRTLFLGAAAVDARGVYVDTGIERPTKRAMMAMADRIVLLVDSTKFAGSAPVRLCELSEVDFIISDTEPAADAAAELQRSGVPFILAH